MAVTVNVSPTAGFSVEIATDEVPAAPTVIADIVNIIQAIKAKSVLLIFISIPRSPQIIISIICVLIQHFINQITTYRLYEKSLQKSTNYKKTSYHAASVSLCISSVVIPTFFSTSSTLDTGITFIWSNTSFATSRRSSSFSFGMNAFFTPAR